MFKMNISYCFRPLQHDILLIVIYIALLTPLFTLASCESDDLPRQTDEIVVEGWIEDNGYPIVILSRTVNISNKYQSVDSLSNYIIKWAKVTISDGEQQVVLTGKYTKDYFPPYIYTTSRLLGKAGKTYTITIDCPNHHATATTTIPYPEPINELLVEKCADSDTLYQISMQLKNTAEKHRFYQIFTRVGSASRQYSAAPLGTIDTQVLTPNSKIMVMRGRSVLKKEYTPYFSITDTVAVKLASIDETSYNFWHDYTRSLTTNGNMFFSTQEKIRSNITGGMGYWCGMGTTTKYVIIANASQ